MLLVHLCVIAALTIACSTCSVESWRIHDSISRRSVNENRSAKSWKILASALLSVSAWNIVVGESLPVLAVSGGGKDYATKDIRSEVFENKVLTGKDFTQCDGTGTNFRGAILKGSRFYRANLKGADFSSADLSAASLEDTLLLDADFTDAVLEGAYFSASINDAKSIRGADFTDSLMTDKTKQLLCQRTDLSTTNTKTGVLTSESLLCE